jgi:NADH:ubiquinone oxidoreductase subunit C
LSDRDNPTVDSICSVYAGAEYHEREAYDLLGIRFNDHPDLRRLFLDSTWGFPLRKDYKDDVNIVSK